MYVSGRSYAAKVMHGKGELWGMMHNELEMMNLLSDRHLLRCYNGYKTDRQLTLLLELYPLLFTRCDVIVT